MDPNLDLTVLAADLGLDRTRAYTPPIRSRAELEERIRFLETELEAELARYKERATPKEPSP